MHKLKECKNLGEIFEVIGEENYSFLCKLVISVLVASPTFWAVTNLGMILEVGNAYNAYDFNDKCISMMYVIFSIITLLAILYYAGKIQSQKITFKESFNIVKKDEPWMLWWFVLLIWTIVPIVCSENIMGSIIGTTFLASGYISHIFMFGIMGCVALIPEEERIDLLKSFIVIADILAFILIAYEYNLPIISLCSAAGGISVYSNANHYGYYLAMSILTAMGLYYRSVHEEEKALKRLRYVFSIAFQVYVLMINDTLGAYLGVVFASIAIIFIWRFSGRKLGVKQLLPILIVVVITLASAFELINPSIGSPTGNTIGQSIRDMILDIFKIKNKAADANNAGSLRWGIWKDTIEMIAIHPIVGHGPDVLFNKAGRRIVDSPHNEYLECAFFLGIPGLILYLGGLFNLLINKCKKLKELPISTLIAAGAAIAYLGSAFFGVRKFNSVCFFYLFMGMMITKQNLKKN